MKKILVIIAAYNDKQYIRRQIESIETQDTEISKIIISLDKSEPDVFSYVSKLVSSKKNLALLPYGMRFNGAASNFFRLISDINFSEFDYVALSDQDDIWHPNKISKALNILETSSYDGYSSNVIAFWPNGRKKTVIKSQPQVKWDHLFEAPGPGCTFVLTNKLIVEIQHFVLKNKQKMKLVWLHDWFIYSYARSHGYFWYIDKTPTMYYRQHTSNSIGVNIGLKAFFYRINFVLSGKAIEQSSLFVKLFGLENNPFVKNWHSANRLGLLYLAFQSKLCRRKTSEKIVFFFSCLLLAITKSKKIR